MSDNPAPARTVRKTAAAPAPVPADSSASANPPVRRTVRTGRPAFNVVNPVETSLMGHNLQIMMNPAMAHSLADTLLTLDDLDPITEKHIHAFAIQLERSARNAVNLQRERTHVRFERANQADQSNQSNPDVAEEVGQGSSSNSAS